MPHLAADEVEDQVVVLDGIGEIGLAVVDDDIGAERAHEIEVGRPGGRRHHGPEMLGELHSEGADAAGAGMDEHAFPALEIGRGHEAGQGAQARDRQRSGLDVAETRGLARDGAGQRHDIFGLRAPARLVGDAVDFVAGREGGHR